MAQFRGWTGVAQLIDERAQHPTPILPRGQRAAFAEVTRRLQGEFGNACRGVVFAAEVGSCKRRLAAAIAQAVVDLGGRIAVLTPARHGFRWQQELGGYEMRPKLVRTLSGYLKQFRQGPWVGHPVVLVSHELANWRVDAHSPDWRWGLLPELIALHCRAGAGGQYPDGYGHETPWSRPEVAIAAAEIYSLLDTAARTELSDWASRPWRSTYCSASHYAVGGECREQFERVIGWGLGRFDLIVIDEPRKPRDYEVGLSRLCRHVQGSSECARLALTESPVTANLHQDQLDRALAWVAVPSTIRRVAVESGFAFERAWDLMSKNWRSNPDWDGFRSAAANFDAATTPYVAHFRSLRGTSVSPGFRWLDRARVAKHDAQAGTGSSPPARIARPWQATADKRSNAPTPLQKFRDGDELPEMVVIPAGDFLMGSPPSEEGRGSDEGPQHRVHLASFAMGCKAVSFAEYDRFVEATGWNWPWDEGWGRGARPVINFSWEDAVAYGSASSAPFRPRQATPLLPGFPRHYWRTRRWFRRTAIPKST